MLQLDFSLFTGWNPCFSRRQDQTSYMYFLFSYKIWAFFFLNTSHPFLYDCRSFAFLTRIFAIFLPLNWWLILQIYWFFPSLDYISANTRSGASLLIEVNSLIIYIVKYSPPTSIMSEWGIYQNELSEISSSSMVV